MHLPNRFIVAAASPGDAAPEGNPSGRAEQFVAVSGSESEQVNASAMVIAAYGLFWLLAIGFIYLTFRSQSRLLARLGEVEKRLSEQRSETKDAAL
ncbi:MAG TPA: hypothetical protein VKP30_28180 [Polyangiaceae bacterium]|nr:hypothetical protein [Polyangiaceae bacterium]